MPPMRRITIRRLGALALLALCAGCAKPAGPLLEPGPDAPVWPPPPNEPRVRYLGQFRTNEDLKPRRGFGQRLGRALFGGAEPLRMVGPLGLCTDGGDRLFVAGGAAQTVHVFNLQTREYELWAPPEDTDGFAHPVDVAYDAARGRLLVADAAAATVFVFQSDGAFLGTLGDDRLTRPVGLAIDPVSGDAFVADAGAHRVVVITTDDHVAHEIGERGSQPGQFNFPTYLALGPDGRLYISDSLNFRVQVFDDQGEFLRQIGEKGDMPGYLAQPKGVGVDDAGRLYIVDAHFEAVQLFDNDGRLLMTFGQEGREPGEFWLPVDIGVDGQGRIWVADSYNRRVQVFELLDEETAQ